MLKKGTTVCHKNALKYGLGKVVEVDEEQDVCSVIFEQATFSGVSCNTFILPGELSPSQWLEIEKAKSKQAKKTLSYGRTDNSLATKLTDVIFTFIGGLFTLFFIAMIIYETTGSSKPCNIQYEKAWEQCNRDYNGKCFYLGPKYKPSCNLAEDYLKNP